MLRVRYPQIRHLLGRPEFRSQAQRRKQQVYVQMANMFLEYAPVLPMAPMYQVGRNSLRMALTYRERRASRLMAAMLVAMGRLNYVRMDVMLADRTAN